MSHTPTPWEACGPLVRTKFKGTNEGGGFLIAECPVITGNAAADAARIVKCVNEHDRIARAIAFLNDSIDGGEECRASDSMLGQAIAILEGKGFPEVEKAYCAEVAA